MVLQNQKRDGLPRVDACFDHCREGRQSLDVTGPDTFDFSGAPSLATLLHAEGEGLESPPSTTTANYTPSFLSLTLVRISTDIQRRTNVLA
jgi:hypothetical protein